MMEGSAIFFFTTLVDSSHRSAVASTDPAFRDLYVPSLRRCKGADLRRFYSHSAQKLNHHERLEECHEISDRLEVNDEAVCSIESRTRGQHMTTQWFMYRAGRATASTLYDICHTRVDVPSMSLIKEICYPHENKVSSPAIKHGR